jgi:hypothetical protein
MRPLMMVIEPKHVGAVLNFKIVLRQFTCASVGKKKI